MAKKRRSYQISSGDYNIAGGGGAATTTAGGDFIKIAKGHPNIDNAAHDGFIANGSTVTVMVDAGTQIPMKDDYLYIDNAFETETGQFTYEFVAPTTALPSGVNWAENSDSTDTDMGETRFYGTPSAGTEGTYTMKILGTYPRGRPDEQVEITWVLRVLPSGTTPLWSGTLPQRIIRNTSGEQDIVAAPTTSYADATFTLSNVSGFASGVTPVIDPATGRVYVANVGDVTQAASSHSLTVTADLGEYGTASQTFTGNISYGDAYGSRYFGPANSYRNWSDGSYENDSDPTKVDGTYWFSPNQNSGALKCTSRGRDSSPYDLNDGYGCNYSFSGSSGTSDISSTTGTMYSYLNGWYTGSNDHGMRFKWTVPNGVTSFCVAGISGGCHGGQSWANDGGGSGALAYVNGVTCTPGEEFLVRIGMGRSVTSQSSHWAGDTYMQRVSNSEYIIYCYGAGYYSRQSDLGGNRTWSQYSYANNQQNPGAAWASNDYSSQGAYHGGWSTSYNHGAGTAGWRGTGQGSSNGGSSSNGGARNGRGYSSTYGGSAGGGTGLDGNGVGVQDFGHSYGSADTNSDTNTQYGTGSHGWRYGGGGGSGGSRGTYGENPYTGSGYSSQAIQGGTHGGGGGGAGSSWGSGPGAPGGLRIIWGTGRAYPNTYTTENPTITNQQ